MRNPVVIRRGLAAVLALAVLSPVVAAAQTLVRVTDPDNPVVTDISESTGAGWVDLVGDGQLDLFVSNGNITIHHNALYRNTRAGSFVRVTTGDVVSDSGSAIGGTSNHWLTVRLAGTVSNASGI